MTAGEITLKMPQTDGGETSSRNYFKGQQAWTINFNVATSAIKSKSISSIFDKWVGNFLFLVINVQVLNASRVVDCLKLKQPYLKNNIIWGRKQNQTYKETVCYIRPKNKK